MFERYLQKEGFLEIPMSGKRYRINIEGKILAEDNLEVKTTFDQEGNIVAWMLLWNNWAYYEVATLIAHTFKPIYVPLLHWNKLKALFLDGNKENIHPSNLVWKFPVGLESRQYPGHAFIPGYSRYIINKEGEVMNYMTNKKIRNYINYGGYCVYSLIPDIGKVNTIGRHRALCLAWLDYPVTVDKMHVNHINGVPGDDRLENLEWVTPKGNIYHALRTGLKPDGKEIFVRNLETGEIQSFYTEAEANEALGFYRGAIRMVTNIPLEKRKPYKGYDVRLARERMFWEDIDLEPHADVLDSSEGKIGKEDLYARGLRDDSRPVLTKNILTGEEREHYSLAECARYLGVGIPTVHEKIANDAQGLTNDLILIKDKNDLRPWREVSEEEIETVKRIANTTVLMRNVKTGEVTEFASSNHASRALNLNERAIYNWLLRPNQPMYPGYLQFKLKYKNEPWREPEDIEQENREAIYGTAVLRRDVRTGIVDEFRSSMACSEEMGLSELTIAVRLRNNDQRVYPPGYQFKLKSDPTPWRDVENLKDELDKSKSPKQVRVRNVFTKEEWSFNRLVDASTTLGIPTCTVVTRRTSKTKTPYFQWEFNYDDSEWFNWDDKALELFRLAIEEKKPLKGRGFIITHSLTGESKLYTSVETILKDFKSSKFMIYHCTDTGKPFCRDWRIEFCLPPDTQATIVERL
jgi:hypothetical protein